eukprot:403377483
MIKNSTPKAINFNQTQQQFFSLQPIQIGLQEDVSSNYLNKSLYKIGESITQDAKKDIKMLTNLHHNSLTPIQKPSSKFKKNFNFQKTQYIENNSKDSPNKFFVKQGSNETYSIEVKEFTQIKEDQSEGIIDSTHLNYRHQSSQNISNNQNSLNPRSTFCKLKQDKMAKSKHFDIDQTQEQGYENSVDIFQNLENYSNIKQEFEKDNCRSYLKELTAYSSQKQQIDGKDRLQKQKTFKKSTEFITHINAVVEEVNQISNKIYQNVDKNNGNDNKEELFKAIDSQMIQFQQKIQSKKKQRRLMLNQMNFVKVSKKDLVEQFKSENLDVIQLGFQEVLLQVQNWSKERADLIQKMWKGYQRHLILNLSRYLNDQKDLNQELLKTLDRTMHEIEQKSLDLMTKIVNYKKISFQHTELKEAFQKCANLFHLEEDKNFEMKTKVFNLEKQIELWLPNIDKYQLNPDIQIRLKNTQGSDKKWGMTNDLVHDVGLRDQMLEKLSEQQQWIKSDIERLIQSSVIITNDKIECERLNRELVKTNSKLTAKKLKCKELKIDLDKQKRNLETLLHDLENEKIKNVEFQTIRHKLIKIQNQEKKDRQIQCDLGSNDQLSRAKLVLQDDSNKSKLKKNLTEAKLHSMQAGSGSASPRNKTSIPLDQIMQKVMSKHGLIKQPNLSINFDQKLENPTHRKNSSSLNPKSPKSGISQAEQFKMNQIVDLNQEPIPILYKEKSEQILQVISSMMSKLVIQPYRHMKDLFLEELLNINPHPQKAGEIAEDFLKVILEVHNKDSRIKLLKAFLGLGEQTSYTQPVSQGFVNLLQDTNLAFDDIFTGEVQFMKVDLDQVVDLIYQRLGTKAISLKHQEIIDKSINSIITQSSVLINGLQANLTESSQVHDYRLIKQIIIKEKQRKQQDPFQDLLDETNFKVEIGDFIDYLTQRLKINIKDYVKDFSLFFETNLDTTHRGFISGFELNNLFDMKIKIEVPFLIFMKESLNSIIEYDNLINSELEKVYNKFDVNQGQEKQNTKGISIQAFQHAAKYIMQSLPQSNLKESNQGLKDLTELLEKRKNQKNITLEEFLQIVKDFEFFESYESLRSYNDKNLKKYQVIQKQGSNQNSQQRPIEGKKNSRNFLNYENSNEEKRKKFRRRGSQSRSRYDDIIIEKKQTLRLSQEKDSLKNDLDIKDSHQGIIHIQSSIDLQIIDSLSSDNKESLNAINKIPEISISQEQDAQTEKNFSSIHGSNLNLIKSQESKISDLLNFDKIEHHNKSIDEESKFYSYRSQESQQFLTIMNNKESLFKKNKQALRFSPQFKIQTKLQKPPLKNMKSSQNSEVDHSALLRGMTAKSIKQVMINKRMSTPSSTTSLLQSPMPKGGYILQPNGEKLSLFKNVSKIGNLSITGNKI